jgi:hypothetical protein
MRRAVIKRWTYYLLNLFCSIQTSCSPIATQLLWLVLGWMDRAGLGGRHLDSKVVWHLHARAYLIPVQDTYGPHGEFASP